MMQRLTVAVALLVVLGSRPARSDDDISHQVADLNVSLSASTSAPARATLLLSRSNLYRLRKDWQRSLGDLERAAALRPSLDGLKLRRGQVLLEAGRFGEAWEALEHHLSEHPNDEFAWIQMARATVKLQLYDAGNEAYARAIELSRQPSPDLILEQADAIQARGSKYDSAALKSIESGIEIVGPAIALELRALKLEAKLGHVDRALARLVALTDRAHSKAPWLLRKGQLLHTAGRVEEARLALEEARSDAMSAPLARRGSKANRDLIYSIESLLATIRE